MPDTIGIINITKEEQARTATANAIRAKTGGTSTLAWDLDGGTGFASDVADIPAGGGDFDALLARSLTEIESDTTTLGDYALANYSGLTSVSFPNLTSAGTRALGTCYDLESVNVPKLTILPDYFLITDSTHTHKLTTLNTGNLIEIGEFALNYQTNLEFSAPLTVPVVKSNGCYSLSSSTSTGFKYVPSSPATLGSSAFNMSKMTELSGEIASCGENALYSLSSLVSCTAKFSGTVDGYNLQSCNKLAEIDISSSTIQRFTGTYQFSSIGGTRSPFNRLTLDFRNCTFDTVPSYFCSNIVIFDVYLPNTVKTILNNAFQTPNNLNLYIPETSTIITLAGSYAFQYPQSYNLLIPYLLSTEYRTATNWSVIASHMLGYAPSDTFTDGEVLPLYDRSGYELTWYSDMAHTTQITTCPVGSPEIYCTVGTTQVKLAVTVNINGNSDFTIINDATSAVVDYSAGYFLCDSGDSFTIDIIDPTFGHKLKVGNTGITTLPYTLTVTADVTISLTSWDPAHINADFATATWAEISIVSQNGLTSAIYGNQVGTTKTITLNNGESVQLRLVNADDTLYEKDGGGTTGLVLEAVNCLNYITSKMNSTSTNSGGWNSSYMRSATMADVYSQLPSDFQDVIVPVKIKGSYSGNSSTINTSVDKVFLPASKEIFTAGNNARTEENNVLTTWQYYQTHSTNADRIKQRNGSNAWHWTRSPYSGNSNTFVIVNTDGSAGNSYAGNSSAFAPAFCI